LGGSARRLVLQPLDIAHARFAATRTDPTASRAMRGYDPRWSITAAGRPVADAALLLHRLMAGKLLPPDLMSAMCTRHPLDVADRRRPWLAPGYGLGL